MKGLLPSSWRGLAKTTVPALHMNVLAFAEGVLRGLTLGRDNESEGFIAVKDAADQLARVRVDMILGLGKKEDEP